MSNVNMKELTVGSIIKLSSYKVEYMGETSDRYYFKPVEGEDIKQFSTTLFDGEYCWGFGKASVESCTITLIKEKEKELDCNILFKEVLALLSKVLIHTNQIIK